MYQQYSYVDPASAGMTVQDVKNMTASRLASNVPGPMLPQIQQSSTRSLQGSISQSSLPHRPLLNNLSRPKSNSNLNGKSLAPVPRPEPSIATLSVQDIKELTRQRLAREAEEKEKAAAKRVQNDSVALSNAPVLEPMPSSRSVDGLQSSRLKQTPSPNRVRFEGLPSSSFTPTPPAGSGHNLLSGRPTSRPETLSPNGISGVTGVGSATVSTRQSPAGFGASEFRLSPALTLLGDGPTNSTSFTSGLASGLPHHSTRSGYSRASSQNSLATVEEIPLPSNTSGLRAEPKESSVRETPVRPTSRFLVSSPLSLLVMRLS
jgi:hypothetical protein